MESITAEEIVEDMKHCAVIASSAITLALDRSTDINAPPVITFMLLKKLCEANIEQEFTDAVPDEIVEAFAMRGKDFHKMRATALKELNEMADDYFRIAVKKVVTR